MGRSREVGTLRATLVLKLKVRSGQIYYSAAPAWREVFLQLNSAVCPGTAVLAVSHPVGYD